MALPDAGARARARFLRTDLTSRASCGGSSTLASELPPGGRPGVPVITGAERLRGGDPDVALKTKPGSCAVTCLLSSTVGSPRSQSPREWGCSSVSCSVVAVHPTRWGGQGWPQAIASATRSALEGPAGADILRAAAAGHPWVGHPVSLQ